MQYVVAMRESLEKKIKVLEEILRISQHQQEILSKKPMDYKRFDQCVDDKDICIEKIEKMDEGFDLLYQRLGSELKEHREQYADEIKKMQSLISEITDKSITIQAMEQRNRQVLEQVFLEERRELGKGKRSMSVAKNYYQTMGNMNVAGAQYMDQKK